jgi:hypothetical protein
VNRDTKLFHQVLRELFPGKHTRDLTSAQLSEVLRTAGELRAGKFTQPLAANQTAPARYASEH